VNSHILLLVSPILIVSSIFSSIYQSTYNVALASDLPAAIVNPFLASKDLCGDGIDNDGNGFIDDNCGTIALKVTNYMSGAVANISSLCHEDCHVDNEDDEE
jgi:hypothetical protein